MVTYYIGPRLGHTILSGFGSGIDSVVSSGELGPSRSDVDDAASLGHFANLDSSLDHVDSAEDIG